MQILQRYSNFLLCVFLVYFTFCSPGLLSAQTDQVKALNANATQSSLNPTDDQAKESLPQESFISIDFNDVDIEVFIKFISELTGKNFVVDKAVKGKVTIISPTKISVDEAYKVFESVLEVQGFTIVVEIIEAGDVVL